MAQRISAETCVCRVKRPSRKAPSRQEVVTLRCLTHRGLLQSNPWPTPPLLLSRCLRRSSVTVWAGRTNRRRAARISALTQSYFAARRFRTVPDSLHSYPISIAFAAASCHAMSAVVPLLPRKLLCPNLFRPLLQFSSPAPPTASVMRRRADLSMTARPCICTPRTRTVVRRR